MNILFPPHPRICVHQGRWKICIWLALYWGIENKIITFPWARYSIIKYYYTYHYSNCAENFFGDEDFWLNPSVESLVGCLRETKRHETFQLVQYKRIKRAKRRYVPEWGKGRDNSNHCSSKYRTRHCCED